MLVGVLFFNPKFRESLQKSRKSVLQTVIVMYWALTHVEELQEKFGLDSAAGAKQLEEAGGKMMSALGKSRFDLVSEHATGVVRARATTAL